MREVEIKEDGTITIKPTIDDQGPPDELDRMRVVSDSDVTAMVKKWWAPRVTATCRLNTSDKKSSRRPSVATQLTRALKGVRKADFKVGEIEVKDGVFTIRVTNGVDEPTDELDRELAEFRARHGYD